MSHTRGKDKNNPGKFAFECFDWDGGVFRAEGGFETAQEADRAAEEAEREMMAIASGFVPQPVTMTDDELIRALLG